MVFLKPGRRLIGVTVAAVMLVAMATSICALATSTESRSNAGLEDKSTTYDIATNEYLRIDYLAGNPVQVEGSGLITTQSTQNWTVYAKDGIKWTGTISDAEDPRWRLSVQWNFALKAVAKPITGSSTHRAFSGSYGVLQKNLVAAAGRENDYHYTEPGYAGYVFNVTPPDGDGTGYWFNGTKDYQGSVVEYMSGYAIDKDEWPNQATVDLWVFNRGWMTLRSNGSTKKVVTKIDGLVFVGTMQTWDFSGPRT